MRWDWEQDCGGLIVSFGTLPSLPAWKSLVRAVQRSQSLWFQSMDFWCQTPGFELWLSHLIALRETLSKNISLVFFVLFFTHVRCED